MSVVTTDGLFVQMASHSRIALGARRAVTTAGLFVQMASHSRTD